MTQSSAVITQERLTRAVEQAEAKDTGTKGMSR